MYTYVHSLQYMYICIYTCTHKHEISTVHTSCSHWKAVFIGELTNCRPSSHTWNPPSRNLHWEHARRQALPARSKFTKVTFEMINLPLFCVLIPPCWGLPWLWEVCPTISEFYWDNIHNIILLHIRTYIHVYIIVNTWTCTYMYAYLHIHSCKIL